MSATTKTKFTVRVSREAFEYRDVEVEAESEDAAQEIVEQQIEDHELPDEGWELGTGESTPCVTDVSESEC